MKRVAIVGSGWVGEHLGKSFRRMGHEVVFYDVVRKNLPNFTQDINYAVECSDVSFVCVPTPTKNRRIDLSYIKRASSLLGKALASRDTYHVVSIKSTVVPTTTEKVVIPILEKYSKKHAGEFGICVNPEFMTMIERSWTKDASYARSFLSQERIVVGQYDKKSGDVLEELYRPLGKPLCRTELRVAEMIKYASNCMLATKISFWNEMFLICRELQIDSDMVSKIASLDSRIGVYGTIHGKAFGGKCLPKDLEAFISFAASYRRPELLKTVQDINKEMRKTYGVRE